MTYVALLRAVNVGGRGVVKMTDLRAAFERAGCRSVRTFIASGNVVFDTSGRLTRALTARIDGQLLALFGRQPGICYRTIDELDAVVAAHPFGALMGDTALKLYIAFMAQPPKRPPKLPLVVPGEAIEVLSLRGADAFIVSRRKPNGMYGFPNACVEQLGVTATTRNWNTVTKLASFARATPSRLAGPAAGPAAGRGGRAGSRSRAS